jgi:tetratricopeptide (TPR) repeat protein
MQKWQTVPIFVAGPFTDTHAERDWLQFHVFPALRERLRSRAVHLEPVDLRWGVDTSGIDGDSAKDLLVLKVCFREVQRCRPFAIAVLGDCYGWIPPVERSQAAAVEAGCDFPVVQKSISHIELDVGFLGVPADERRSFVYIRNPSALDKIPRHLAGRYSDSLSNRPDRAQAVEQLARLKAQLKKEMPDRVRQFSVSWDNEHERFTGLEQFGEQVIDDLWRELSALTADATLATDQTWQDLERLALNEFLEVKGRGFVRREALIRTSVDLLKSENGRCVCLVAPPGAGKSALFTRLCRLSAGDGNWVLIHAAGISTRSNRVDSMLERWAGDLTHLLGEEETNQIAEEQPGSAEHVERRFARLLGRAALKRPIILLIDALDEFEPTVRARYLTWLPNPLPSTVRVLITSRPGSYVDDLVKKGILQIIAVPDLDSAESACIIDELCAQYHRQLPKSVRKKLLSKPHTEQAPAYRSPLWLGLASEQLNLLDQDDYRRVSTQFEGTPGERVEKLLTWFADQMPPEIPALYAWTINRVEELYGDEWVRALLALLVIGRDGWRESDLRQLISCVFGQEWTDLRFAAVRRALGSHLSRRGPHALWSFAHSQLREAATNHVLAGENARRDPHRVIADFLETLPHDDPIRQSEIMYHIVQSGDLARAAEWYSSDLHPGEVEGASQVLAEWIIAGDELLSNYGLEAVCGFVDILPNQTDQKDQLATRILWKLWPRIQSIAPQSQIKLLLRTKRAASSRSTLRKVLHTLGDLFWQTGQIHSAVQEFTELEKIAREAGKINEHDIDALYDLAVALQKQGDLVNLHGDTERALRLYLDLLPISRELAELQPDNFVMARNLTVAESKIGDGYWSRRDFTTAERHYAAAHEQAIKLDSRFPGTPTLLHDLSISLEKMGQIRQIARDWDAALICYRPMVTIADRLRRNDPLNPEWDFDKALAHQRIGDILLSLGSQTDSASEYDAMLSVANDLIRKQPTNAAWRHLKAWAFYKLGHACRANQDVPKAIEHTRLALELFEELAQIDPSNGEWKTGLWRSAGEMAAMFDQIGDRANAASYARMGNRLLEQMARDGIPIIEGGIQSSAFDRLVDARIGASEEMASEELGGQADDASDFQTRLIHGAEVAGKPVIRLSRQSEPQFSIWHPYLNKADELYRAGDLLRALKLYQDAAVLVETAVQNGAATKSQLAEAHVHWGAALQEGRRDAKNALDHYRLAATLWEANTTGHAIDLADVYGKIGDSLLSLSQSAEAKRAFLTGLEHARGLTDTSREGTVLHALSVLGNKLGSVCLAEGDQKSAASFFAESQRIGASLWEQFPDDGEYAKAWAISSDLLGLALLGTGDLEDALGTLRGARKIWIALVKTNPNNLELQRDLAICNEYIGDAQKTLEDWSAALEAYQSSVSGKQQLAARDSTSVEWQQDLAIGLFKLGQVHGRLGDGRAESACLYRCFNVLHALHSQGAQLSDFAAHLLEALAEHFGVSP